jgi:hypothetical protein
VLERDILGTETMGRHRKACSGNSAGPTWAYNRMDISGSHGTLSKHELYVWVSCSDTMWVTLTN